MIEAANENSALRRGVLDVAASPRSCSDSVAFIFSAMETQMQLAAVSGDAALKAGINAPHSCQAGMCASCMCQVVEGEVRMERNFALDKNEVACGFVLTCQCRPLSAQVVLSFDER